MNTCTHFKDILPSRSLRSGSIIAQYVVGYDLGMTVDTPSVVMESLKKAKKNLEIVTLNGTKADKDYIDNQVSKEIDAGKNLT